MSENVNALAAAVAAVRAEIARVDGKATALASIATLLMTVGTAGLVTIDMPWPALTVGWAAAAATVAAIWMLVAALKPGLNTKQASQAGPLSWRHHTPATALDLCHDTDAIAEGDAAQLVFLSGLAYRKWRCVWLACHMLLAALAGGVAAAVLTALR